MEAPNEIWLIGQAVSEEMFNECGRQWRTTTTDDDGRTTEPAYTISSPNVPKGSGELKRAITGKFDDFLNI